MAGADRRGRANFEITTYIKPPGLTENIDLQRWIDGRYRQEIPAENMYWRSNLVAVHGYVQSLNQVSNMISPEIIDCRDLGWIACNSVISKLYAKGATQCDSIVMHLLICAGMESNDRRYSAILDIVNGFKDCAEREETKVTSGLLVDSKYLWVGGVASSFHPVDDYMVWKSAEAGDWIFLTKPLGTLIAARYKYMVDHGDRAPSVDRDFNSRVEQAYELAVRVMRSSNKDVAALMKSHGVRAVFDVNGRSLLQCAEELLGMQHRPVYLRFHEMPVIQHTPEIARILEIDLIGGRAPELSGGLLICIPERNARSFTDALIRNGIRNVFAVARVLRTFREDRLGLVHFQQGIIPFEWFENIN